MRLRTWLRVSAFALAVACTSVYADKDDRDKERREANREYRNDVHDRDKEWRQYLKERHKAYKHWSKADRKEREEYDRYRREHGHAPFEWER